MKLKRLSRRISAAAEESERFNEMQFLSTHPIAQRHARTGANLYFKKAQVLYSVVWDRIQGAKK